MYNLVIKDILIQKKTLVISILFALIYMVAFQHSSDFPALSILIPLMITYMLMMNACAYDDKNKSDILLNSLPINRDDIIIAKYLSAFLFLLIGIVVTIAVACTMKFLGTKSFLEDIDLKYILLCLLMNTIIVSVFLPVFFKFGNIKARYFNIAFFLIIFFVSAALGSYLRKGEIPWAAKYFLNQPDWMIYILGIGIILILLLISILFSMIFYLKRDL